MTKQNSSSLSNNIRPWSNDIGDDNIDKQIIDSYKNEDGSFQDSIYDNLNGNEFSFWIEKVDKFGFPPHVTICPTDYVQYNSGHFWEQNISCFLDKLEITKSLNLEERYPCYFLTTNSFEEVEDVLTKCGMTINKDLKL